jgi:hypothetical protein
MTARIKRPTLGCVVVGWLGEGYALAGRGGKIVCFGL